DPDPVADELAGMFGIAVEDDAVAAEEPSRCDRVEDRPELGGELGAARPSGAHLPFEELELLGPHAVVLAAGGSGAVQDSGGRQRRADGGREPDQDEPAQHVEVDLDDQALVPGALADEDDEGHGRDQGDDGETEDEPLHVTSSERNPASAA